MPISRAKPIPPTSRLRPTLTRRRTPAVTARFLSEICPDTAAAGHHKHQSRIQAFPVRTQITNSPTITLYGTALPATPRSPCRVPISACCPIRSPPTVSATGPITTPAIGAAPQVPTISRPRSSPTALPASPSADFLVTVDLTAPGRDRHLLTVPGNLRPAPALVVDVAATDNVGLPANDAVALDVDLNNDGSYSGGELGYATGTLTNAVPSTSGSAEIVLPTLPSTGTYRVRGPRSPTWPATRAPAALRPPSP